MEGHAGPFFYDRGTLPAQDADEIFSATGVSARIRERKQWQNKRGLTLSGPIKNFEKARTMADEKIKASIGHVSQNASAEVADPALRASRLASSKRIQEWVQRTQTGIDERPSIPASVNAQAAPSNSSWADVQQWWAWQQAGAAPWGYWVQPGVAQSSWNTWQAATWLQQPLDPAPAKTTSHASPRTSSPRATGARAPADEQAPPQKRAPTPEGRKLTAPPRESTRAASAKKIQRTDADKKSGLAASSRAKQVRFEIPLSPSTDTTSESYETASSRTEPNAQGSPAQAKAQGSPAQAKAQGSPAQAKAQLSPAPAAAKFTRYHFFSIGRKQEYDSVEHTLESAYDFDMKHTIVVNVECIPNPGRDTECKEHTGHHEHIWERIASSGVALKTILRSLKSKLERIPKDARDVCIVFVCKWGKHRSVGVAEMMSVVFQKNHKVVFGRASHLSKSKWSKWKCGWKKCDCNAMTDSKNASLFLVQKAWCEMLKSDV